jgi:hypothetical protein
MEQDGPVWKGGSMIQRRTGYAQVKPGFSGAGSIGWQALLLWRTYQVDGAVYTSHRGNAMGGLYTLDTCFSQPSAQIGRGCAAEVNNSLSQFCTQESTGSCVSTLNLQQKLCVVLKQPEGF